jgi:hypothetical protein
MIVTVETFDASTTTGVEVRKVAKTGVTETRITVDRISPKSQGQTRV